MVITYSHPILKYRSVYLFCALIAWMLVSPFLESTLPNHILEVMFNVIILLTAVMAIAKSRLSLVISLVLAIPVPVLWYVALRRNEPVYGALAWGYTTAFYIYVLSHLMRYVLRREVVTTDKLFGAAAVYLMLAITWAGLYGVTQYFYPGSFSFLGAPKVLDGIDLIYFSFTALTTTGFGDIVPVLRQTRFLAVLEACTGVLYTAITIARLASNPSADTNT
jgi:Ion channel